MNPLYERQKRSYHFGSYADVNQQHSTAFIPSVVCLKERPPHLPEWVPHRMQSSSSSSSFQYPPFSWRSTINCLRLPVISLLLLFSSLTHFRRQLIRKVWPIHLAFLLIFGSISSPNLPYAIPLHFSHDRSNWSSTFSSIIFQTFQLFPIRFSKCPIFSTIQGCNTV